MGSAPDSGLLIGFFLVFMKVLMISLQNPFFNLARDLFFAKMEIVHKFDLPH